MENKQKRNAIALIVVAVLIFVGIIGYAFAYFSATVTVDNQTETKLKSNVLGIEYEGVTDINITDIVPGDYMTKTFKVTNTSTHEVDFNIYMEAITNEFNEDLVYTLTDDNGTVVAQTALPTTNDGKSYLIKKVSIVKDEVKNYTLTIKFLYKETDQNDLQGKQFKATVGIDTEGVATNQTIDPNNTPEPAKAFTLTDNDSNSAVSIGDLVTVGTESFYVYSVDTTSNTVKVISKGNLDANNNVQTLSDSYAVGSIDTNVYTNTPMYTSTTNYINKLNTDYSLNITQYGAITTSELAALGCVIGSDPGPDTCETSTYSWIIGRYFTSTPGKSGGDIVIMYASGQISYDAGEEDGYSGRFNVRPTMTISLEDIG